MWNLWCTDSLNPRQFGSKTLQHHQDRSELSGQFGTSADMSYRQFGTGAKVSWVWTVLGPKCLYSLHPTCCLLYHIKFWPPDSSSNIAMTQSTHQMTAAFKSFRSLPTWEMRIKLHILNQTWNAHQNQMCKQKPLDATKSVSLAHAYGQYSPGCSVLVNMALFWCCCGLIRWKHKSFYRFTVMIRGSRWLVL